MPCYYDLYHFQFSQLYSDLTRMTFLIIHRAYMFCISLQCLRFPLAFALITQQWPHYLPLQSRLSQLLCRELQMVSTASGNEYQRVKSTKTCINQQIKHCMWQVFSK